MTLVASDTLLLDQTELYTDYYELTMAQGYFLSGRKDETATFDYFFREIPFDGGYVVFAGLTDLLNHLKQLRFHDDSIDYLRKQGFQESFLEYLADFSFTGDLHAVKEGEIVFPNEPIVRVTGSIIETQLIETFLLNLLNFESLIATKASRMRLMAGDRKLIDFGLRRSQGLGGILASRASIIGGFEATSNVYAARKFDIPASGTMAHSWIQSFDSELEAFQKFAELYPENSILLVDTYDTLESGVPNAIKVGKALEEEGHQLKGIRLDSGDLAYFARESRKMLDEAGMEYVKIAASNQLDEYVIRSLLDQQAPIDVFGVGTRLVTGDKSPALDGVYKLSQLNGQPKLKLSENIEKQTLPAQKQIYRFFDNQGLFYGDAVTLTDEQAPNRFYHPHIPNKNASLANYSGVPLLTQVMQNGRVTDGLPTITEASDYAKTRLKQLPSEYKRFDNPHIYKVGISKELMDTRDQLLNQYEITNSND
jgi:nicotinate phosphoribosyltransferase